MYRRAVDVFLYRTLRMSTDPVVAVLQAVTGICSVAIAAEVLLTILLIALNIAF